MKKQQNYSSQQPSQDGFLKLCGSQFLGGMPLRESMRFVCLYHEIFHGIKKIEYKFREQKEFTTLEQDDHPKQA